MASQQPIYHGEASEGCRAIARRAKAGFQGSRATARQATHRSIVAKRASA